MVARGGVISSGVISISTVISGADGANLDVAVDDGRIGGVLLDVGRVAGSNIAGAAVDARGGRIHVSGVIGVQPEHAGIVCETVLPG